MVIVLFFSVISCKVDNSLAINELETIIDEHFPNVPTYSKLIPLRSSSEQNYDQVIAKYERSLIKDDIKPKFDPKPPDLDMYRKYIPIGFATLRDFIRYGDINKSQFQELKKFLKKHEGLTSKINTKIPVYVDFYESILKGEVDELQDFSYPILIGNKLIFLRNKYSGLLHSKSLGVIGSGTYYIFEKTEGKWKRKMFFNVWIT